MATKANLVTAIQRKLKSIQTLDVKLKPLEVKKKKLNSELDELKFQLIKIMGDEKEDSFESKKLKFRISKNDHYQIKDWPAMTSYIKRSGHFELFTKKINTTAFRELYLDDEGNYKMPKWAGRFTKVNLLVNETKK